MSYINEDILKKYNFSVLRNQSGLFLRYHQYSANTNWNHVYSNEYIRKVIDLSTPFNSAYDYDNRRNITPSSNNDLLAYSVFSGTDIEEAIVLGGKEYMFKGCTNLKNVKLCGTLEGEEHYDFILNMPISNNDKLSRTRWLARAASSPLNVKWKDAYSFNTSYGNSNPPLAAHMFEGCTSLRFAYIDQTTIPAYAFYECSNLHQVVIPDSLTSIGDWAFYRTALPSIKLPSSITSTGLFSFSECNIQTLDLSDCNNLQSISQGLCNTNPLTSIIWPSNNNIETIYNTAFSNTSLTSVTLPEGVTTLKGSVFFNCRNLTSVTFPSTLTSIGSMCFTNTSLTSVTLPSGCEYYSNSFPSGTTITGGTLISN